MLTLEFGGPIFSGNGVYARSIARALATHVPGVALHIVSGACGEGDDDVLLASQDEEIRNFSLTLLRVPAERWRRVDRSGGFADLHQQMQLHAHSVAGALHSAWGATTTSRHGPLQVLLVDWSSLPMWRCLHAALPPDMAAACRVSYLNFRVYARTRELHTSGDADELFYTLAELLTMHSSHCTLALCRVDALALASMHVRARDAIHRVHALRDGPAACAHAYSTLCDHLALFLPAPVTDAAAVLHAVEACIITPPMPRIGILLPPLRESIRVAALSLPAADATPLYLPCVVRHSPEKGALKFAHACAAIATELREMGITPLLAGAVADAAYSAATRQVLTTACSDAVIMTEFLTPASLARIFNHSLVNVHPCTHDAYGMTVVEAAACACASLVQCVPSATGDAGGRVVAAFERVFPATGELPSSGAFWMKASDTLLDALDAQMSTLATVGACDLLGDALLSPAADAATLGVDWAASDEVVAAQLLRHVRVLFGARKAGGDAVSSRARQIADHARHWDEAAFATALCAMIA